MAPQQQKLVDSINASLKAIVALTSETSPLKHINNLASDMQEIEFSFAQGKLDSSKLSFKPVFLGDTKKKRK